MPISAIILGCDDLSSLLVYLGKEQPTPPAIFFHLLQPSSNNIKPSHIKSLSSYPHRLLPYLMLTSKPTGKRPMHYKRYLCGEPSFNYLVSELNKHIEATKKPGYKVRQFEAHRALSTSSSEASTSPAPPPPPAPTWASVAATGSVSASAATPAQRQKKQKK